MTEPTELEKAKAIVEAHEKAKAERVAAAKLEFEPWLNEWQKKHNVKLVTVSRIVENQQTGEYRPEAVLDIKAND